MALGDLVVVVNASNPVEQLSRSEVVDIYMGRRATFPDGRTALPIDLPSDSPLREAYYRSLVDKTIPQINSYWARLLFTGRATPPRALSDLDSVLETVAENRDAIGYADSDHLPPGVKVVLTLQ
ncbi:hypothetical protein G3480_23690 [Thiorhodococcus mannitoliphagus]|uniref:Phosphate ABC transporter substrate-binding protein n=2 Tax=Thiorhodococcus mannitoliphagus TaxID=329406 RepID=A0A6P1E224_9GAMM|nr:hypothetical protein [Thiorhodococcus mannitoliphagus]